MATFADERIDWLSGPDGLMARRSWELVPGAGTVLLRGLFGFPWPERDVQAKCTQRDYAGNADVFGVVRVDRHHPSVPAPGCTCGIYASEEPPHHWLTRRYLARRVLVHGFVRLSGRVLFDGRRYRAEQARIEGPLVVAVPPPGVRGRRRTRRRRNSAVVVTDGDRYRVAYGPWAKAARGGEGLETWHERVAEALAARYGVAVERAPQPA